MARYVKWYVNVGKWIPTKEEWLSLSSSIAEEETVRISRFVYQEDAKSSLIGRALIRSFLNFATKIPSGDIKLTRTENGRPEICLDYKLRALNFLPKFLDFNVSHSGDYCVLGGFWSTREEDDLAIGVDVTKIVRKNNKEELNRFLDLMSRREFTHQEWELVEKAADDREKCINFTRLWCLKESFIKSVGLGLKFGLGRISFVPNTSLVLSDGPSTESSTSKESKDMISDTRVLVDEKPAGDWKFLEAALDSEHLVAIGYNLRASRLIEGDGDIMLDKSSPKEVNVESLLKMLTPTQRPNEAYWEKFSSSPSRT